MIDDRFQLERKVDRLQKTIDRTNARQTSIFYLLWQGLLVGIGSTAGVIIVIYIMIVVIRPLELLPLVGDLFSKYITPTLERVIEDKLPKTNFTSQEENTLKTDIAPIEKNLQSTSSDLNQAIEPPIPTN